LVYSSNASVLNDVQDGYERCDVVWDVWDPQRNLPHLMCVVPCIIMITKE